MQKHPIIIGNWKMKTDPARAETLARTVVKIAEKYKLAEVVICPSHTELALVSGMVRNSRVKLGSQNCFWEERGAFTGEISPIVLKEYGVSYVLVGHSERRQFLGESDAMIHKKVRILLSLGITPVVCIGETFDERQNGTKDAVLLRKVTSALDGLSLHGMNELIIAYEPIWVIGSGQAVDPFEAEHTHRIIKQALYDLFPDTLVDQKVRFIYGGSIDPENIHAFMSQPTIDGALVGSSSLDAALFGATIAQALH